MARLSGWSRLIVLLLVVYLLIGAGLGVFFRTKIYNYRVVHDKEVRTTMEILTRRDFFDNENGMAYVAKQTGLSFDIQEENGFEYYKVGDKGKYMRSTPRNFNAFLRSIARSSDGNLVYNDPTLAGTVINLKTFMADMTAYESGALRTDYREARQKYIYICLALLFAPPLILFVFGFGVSWIVAGFKKAD
ncbi:hypothetical protein HOH87_01020 [bacterium]|jgi:hypothetical protein|nr:hypothetical protein [bacterium]